LPQTVTVTLLRCRLLLALTLFALAPLSTGVAEAATPTAYTFAGHGYGHGKGMSQHGAQGAALQGLTAEQILAFYYPGTTLTTVKARTRVLLTGVTAKGTVVLAQPHLIARVPGGHRYELDSLRPGASRWRLRPVPGGRTALAARGAGRWQRVALVDGVVEFFAGGAPVTVKTPAGLKAYRGALRNAGGVTVNVLATEKYLRGVVPSEMPSGWQPAALQAQAIAARSYAAYDRARTPAGRAWQTCDSVMCQVYGGVAGESAQATAAIAATRGRIVSYAGQPAYTQFSSSNGGMRAPGTEPYLAGGADPYDGWSGNGHTDWTTTLTAAQIAAKWPQVGTLTALDVLTRDGQGEWGGRVTSIRLTGTAGTITVDGNDFRLALGLKSTWFSLS